jgi:hypothetical protein
MNPIEFMNTLLREQLLELKNMLLIRIETTKDMNSRIERYKKAGIDNNLIAENIKDLERELKAVNIKLKLN